MSTLTFQTEFCPPKHTELKNEAPARSDRSGGDGGSALFCPGGPTPEHLRGYLKTWVSSECSNGSFFVYDVVR